MIFSVLARVPIPNIISYHVTPRLQGAVGPCSKRSCESSIYLCSYTSFCFFQRQAKYSENKLKCTKARNDYLLNLAATNAAVSKYYIHDVSDLIDVSASFSACIRPALCCALWRVLWSLSALSPRGNEGVSAGA